jgi:predicted secreted Zn-dependent protease
MLQLSQASASAAQRKPASILLQEIVEESYRAGMHRAQHMTTYVATYARQHARHQNKACPRGRDGASQRIPHGSVAPLYNS